MAMSSRGSSSPSAGRSSRSGADLAIAAILVAVCIVLTLSACKNVLNDGDEEESFHVRMVNLLEDSPSVQYSVDDTAVSSIGYLAATGFTAGHPGTRTISFAAVRPSSLNEDDETDPIALAGAFEQSYARDRDYTVFAYGTLNNPKTLVMDEQSDRDEVEDELIEYQIVNVSPQAPSVDVYITAAEGQITSPQKVATLAFGEKSSPATLRLFRRPDVTDEDAALFVDFVIELRDPATGDELFKSAKMRLTEKTRLLWAIVDNTGPGPSKSKLLGVDGYGGILLNTTDQAAVRIVNVSPDTPPVDIIRGSSLSTKLAENLAFRDRSTYVNVPAGDVDLIAVPAGQTNVFLFLEEFSALGNGYYSAYAVGPLASVDAFVLPADDRRGVPTQGKFRFFNAAPSLDGEDGLQVYLTLPGQTLDFDSSDDSDTDDDVGQFTRGTISYKTATDYVVLKSGTYQVRMAPIGTSRLVLDTTITVQDGSVATYALIDSETGDLELMPVEEALTD